VTRFSGSVVIE